MIGTFTNSQVNGDFFKLKTSDPRHVGGREAKSTTGSSFGDLLMSSMNDVNDKQIQYADLSQKAVIDPSSVDPHDITIAGAEANLSLNIAKNVLDRVVRAYRDITTMR